MLCSASSRLNATEEQLQNVDLLILSTICNHGNYFASHRGSEAFLILQVNPVIWGIWGEKKELLNALH